MHRFCGNGDVEVRSCKFGPDHPTPCGLHPFRLGRNPNISRSAEWKQAAAERLARANVAALPTKPIETPDLMGDLGLRGLGPGKGTAVGNSARPIGQNGQETMSKTLTVPAKGAQRPISHRVKPRRLHDFPAVRAGAPGASWGLWNEVEGLDRALDHRSPC